MKKLDLGQSIGILANLGVIAGIIFLAYEIRQSTLVANVSAADFYIASINEVNNLIVENEELVPLLIKARQTDRFDEEDILRLNLIWGNALRNWQRAYYLYEQGVLDELFWHTQLGDMEGALAANRHFYQYWEQRQDRYDPEFNEILAGFASAFETQ